MQQSKLVTTLCTITLCLLFTGCSAGDHEPASGKATASPKDIVVHTIPDVQEGGPQAAFAGRLKITDDCLYAEDEGGVSFDMVFPEGTELTSDGKAIRLPDDKEYFVGDHLTFGGGYFQHESDRFACPRQSSEYFIISSW